MLDLTELLLLKKQPVELSHGTVAESPPRLKHDIDKRTNPTILALSPVRQKSNARYTPRASQRHTPSPDTRSFAATAQSYEHP